MRTLNHKGYEAVLAYDASAALFHGEIANLRDVITFQGRSEDEAAAAMAESIDDYLDFCRTRGEEPEVPPDGPRRRS